MSEDIKIGNTFVGKDQSCFIIAEAGSNHDGCFQQALKLIDIASEAKADAVKFQIFTADRIAAKTNHEMAQLNHQYGKDLFELYQGLEMPKEWISQLAEYCCWKNIMFLATPFDQKAVDDLEKINIPAYKIASFELGHLPLLKYVAQTGKPIIISTGMAYLSEIEEAIQTIQNEGNHKIIILHCGISYPMPLDEVNLKAMDTVGYAFDMHVGYSDHTQGITVPIAAAARGARVIEKHYTVDKTLKGPDHAFALEPNELKEMVKQIRAVEEILGDGIKQPTKKEVFHRKQGKRSLFVNREMKKGEQLTLADIEVLRPGIGMAPRYIEKLIGRQLKKNLSPYDPITWDVI